MKTKPRAAFMLDDDGKTSMTADTVIEQEPEFIGLLDTRGNRLYRQRESFGFAIPKKMGR